jgi:tetratricopeptide (TPR) repeat protein
VPRGNAKPLRPAGWVLVAPWKIGVHKPPAAADLSDAQKALVPLFDAKPMEVRASDVMAYWLTSSLTEGAGPNRSAERDFVITASAAVRLPPGRYRIDGGTDAQLRVWIDGQKLWDVPNKLSNRPIAEFADAPREVRVAYHGGPGNVYLAFTPSGAGASDMLAAARGWSYEADAIIERTDHAIASGPSNAGTLRERGIAHVRLGRFREAEADLAKAALLDPDEHFSAYLRSAILQYLGRADEARKLNKEMSERFRTTVKAEVADRTAKAALLTPDPDDLPTLIQLSDRAVSMGGKYLAWFRIASGLAKIRAAQASRVPTKAQELCADADAVLLKARQSLNFEGHGEATIDYLRALAAHVAGRPADARQFLNDADAFLAGFDPKPGAGDLHGTSGVENWLICQIVRREAHAMIDVPAAK